MTLLNLLLLPLIAVLGLFLPDGGGASDAGAGASGAQGGGTAGGANAATGEGGATGSGSAGTGAAGGAAGGAAQEGGQAATSAQAGTSSVNVEALQRELNTARSDAGRYRTAATATLAALAKHLGIELDIDGKGKFDPEDATAKLQREIDALRAENRSNALAVGLERVFTKLGANPKVTGPYIASKVKDLDPKADDFTTKLEQIVQEAIDEEPALRAAQVARRSGGEFNGNGSASAEVEDPAKLAALVPRT